MKSKVLYCSLLFGFIMSIFQFSCKTTERGALSCPDISVRQSKYAVSHGKYKSPGYIAARSKNKKPTRVAARNIMKKEDTRFSATPSLQEHIRTVDKIEYNRSLMASLINVRTGLTHPDAINDRQLSSWMPEATVKSSDVFRTGFIQQSCDTIFLKSGSSVTGKVEEIGLTEIKYRNCSNLEGPVISVLKSNVASIKYINGTRDYFDASEIYIPNPNQQREINRTQYVDTDVKYEGLGIAGFVSGLVGLFIASIPLGIIAIVFGAISLNKIKRNPGMYRGKGLAKAAIILGIVDIVAMLVILGTLSSSM